jgi:hypothetical protein
MCPVNATINRHISGVPLLARRGITILVAVITSPRHYLFISAEKKVTAGSLHDESHACIRYLRANIFFRIKEVWLLYALKRNIHFLAGPTSPDMWSNLHHKIKGSKSAWADIIHVVDWHLSFKVHRTMFYMSWTTIMFILVAEMYLLLTLILQV